LEGYIEAEVLELGLDLGGGCGGVDGCKSAFGFRVSGERGGFHEGRIPHVGAVAGGVCIESIHKGVDRQTDEEYVGACWLFVSFCERVWPGGLM